MKQTAVKQLRAFLEENGRDTSDRTKFIQLVQRIRIYTEWFNGEDDQKMFLSCNSPKEGQPRVYDFVALCNHSTKSWRFEKDTSFTTARITNGEEISYSKVGVKDWVVLSSKGNTVTWDLETSYFSFGKDKKKTKKAKGNSFKQKPDWKVTDYNQIKAQQDASKGRR